MSVSNMVTLPIQSVEGQLVVDSRLVAEQLGIEHHNFLQNVQVYQSQVEQAFGFLLFQTGEIDGRGRPEKYALLTENQAAFLMTLSRNTPQVVAAKLGLVVAFSRAKELIASATPIATAKPDPFWELIDNATQRGIEPERAIDLHRRFKIGSIPPPPPKPPAVSPPPQAVPQAVLADFLARVKELQDDGLLDERGVVQIHCRRENRDFLAVHVAVWGIVSAKTLPYSRDTLERSIVQGGGFVEQQTQKFRQTYDGPRTAARKCWLLPI
jgi:phage regulator Rha-like protein